MSSSCISSCQTLPVTVPESRWNISMNNSGKQLKLSTFNTTFVTSFVTVQSKPRHQLAISMETLMPSPKTLAGTKWVAETWSKWSRHDPNGIQIKYKHEQLQKTFKIGYIQHNTRHIFTAQNKSHHQLRSFKVNPNGRNPKPRQEP